MTEQPLTFVERLLAHASGSYPAEAAVFVVAGAVRGTLPAKIALAINDYPDEEWAFIDWEYALELSASFSSGERRLIALAASLGSTHEVNLGDALSGLDETNADIVLDALAHALRIAR